MLRIIKLICMLMVMYLLASCSTMDNKTTGSPLARGEKWVLLPIVNHTDVPQAGLRAENIVEALLHSGGINNLTHYPTTLNSDEVFDPTERKVVEEAMKWAATQGAKYAVTGAVDEWRYKVGVDGEPAVGIALQIIEVQTNTVVWSAVGAKSGWSREALSAVAQKLIKELLSTIKLQ